MGGPAPAGRAGISPDGVRSARVRSEPVRDRGGLPRRRRRHRRADGRRRPSRRAFLWWPRRDDRRCPSPRRHEVADVARTTRPGAHRSRPHLASAGGRDPSPVGRGHPRRGVGCPLPEGRRKRPRSVPARDVGDCRAARTGVPSRAAVLRRPSCHSPNWLPLGSRSSSCPEATTSASTVCAPRSPGGSALPWPSSRVPVTRSSSPAMRSTRNCSRCGVPPTRQRRRGGSRRRCPFDVPGRVVGRRVAAVEPGASPTPGGAGRARGGRRRAGASCRAAAA